MSTARQPASTLALRPTSIERFAARARRGRGPRRLLWSALGAVLLCILGAWLVFASPLLTVGSVTVQGVSASAAAAVRERARVPMHVPLARVDTSAVAARALAPDLATVTVRRSWPHSVLIQVTPRVAVLAVRNPQGQVEVLDRFGIAFATAPVAPTGVPVLDAGQSAMTPAAVSSVATVLHLLSARQRGTVSRVTVSAAGLVAFRLGKVDVVWGDGTDSELKLRVMNALVSRASSRLDVSAPRTPALR